MELRQLQYFVEVASREHMTHAAEALHVAQSAISRQIQLLEEELSASLFVRIGKGLRLSPFGQQFLQHARGILRQVELARETARAFHNPDIGRIRLGFPHSMGIAYVPELLAAFRKAAPRVDFVLAQARVHTLVQMVQAGEVDLAVVTPWPPERPTEVREGALLFEESLCAVLPQAHRLAAKSSISMQDLADEQFILFKPGYTLRDIVWQACIAAGFTPAVSFEGEETDTIRGFVRAGFGVSVLPPSDAQTSDLIEIPIVGGRQPVLRSVGLTWLAASTHSAMIQRFVAFALSRGRG